MVSRFHLLSKYYQLILNVYSSKEKPFTEINYSTTFVLFLSLSHPLFYFPFSLLYFNEIFWFIRINAIYTKIRLCSTIIVFACNVNVSSKSEHVYNIIIQSMHWGEKGNDATFVRMIWKVSAFKLEIPLISVQTQSNVFSGLSIQFLRQSNNTSHFSKLKLFHRNALSVCTIASFLVSSIHQCPKHLKMSSINNTLTMPNKYTFFSCDMVQFSRMNLQLFC